jgi:hypothetical protein
LRQEDRELEVSLGFVSRLCLKERTKTTKVYSRETGQEGRRQRDAWLSLTLLWLSSLLEVKRPGRVVGAAVQFTFLGLVWSRVDPGS